MKNFLLFVFFLAAAIGCGTSYMLLRMPQHEVTALIVKYLQVKPGEEIVPDVDPVVEPQQIEAPAPQEKSVKSVEVKPQEEEIWRGFTADNWYAGPKLSKKDFKGKAVLVYEWSAAEKPSVQMLTRIEELWSSFKHKPFIVIGSHRGGKNEKIPNAYKKLELSFPMYEGAGFHKEPSVSTYPYMYVVDHLGNVKYRGRDERAATEVMVTAMTAAQLGGK